MSAEDSRGRSIRPEQTVDEPSSSASAVFSSGAAVVGSGPAKGFPLAPATTGNQTRDNDRSSSADELDGGWVGERYKLVRLLGRGGHGRVYEAIHTHLDRHYALKVLGPPDEARGTKGRFEREAKLLSLLNHENIVGVIDAGVDSVRGQYLVLELVNGKTLADYLDKQVTINTPLLISLVAQVARGLHHAHQQKIVHRDLKPENVMLSPQPDGTFLVKILDFGIAKLTEPGPEAITRSGWSLGTAAYMAPEQARGGRDLDERVDVFAFGVVVYEILAGKRPFDGSSYNETLFKVVSQPHESILVHRPDLSKEVATVLDRALAKDRQFRYASVEAFAKALTSALENTPDRIALPGRKPAAISLENAFLSTDVAPVSDLKASYVPPPVKPWKVAGVAAVVLAAIAGWWLTTPPATTPGVDAASSVSPMASAEPMVTNKSSLGAATTASTPGALDAEPAAAQTGTKASGLQPAANLETVGREPGAVNTPTSLVAGVQDGKPAETSNANRADPKHRRPRKDPPPKSGTDKPRATTAKAAVPTAPLVTPSPAPTPAAKPTPAPAPAPRPGYVLDSPY